MCMLMKLCATVTTVSPQCHLLPMDEGYWKKLVSQKLTSIIIHRPHGGIYLVDDVVASKIMVVIVGRKME